MNKILLIEDNDSIILGLKYLLEEENFLLSVAKSKSDAIYYLNNNIFDLVLLDISLPDGDGFDICKYILTNFNSKIIFLTAKDDEKDVVKALDMGANDYIIKPFRNRELISRIKNVLRNDTKPNEYITISNVKIDTTLEKVYVDGMEVEFTRLEYSILLNLFKNSNRLITREEILNDIWDLAGNFVNDNTLTVYIKRIRAKINDSDGKIIETVRGRGYRIGV